jgi:hypothetical protein
MPFFSVDAAPEDSEMNVDAKLHVTTVFGAPGVACTRGRESASPSRTSVASSTDLRRSSPDPPLTTRLPAYTEKGQPQYLSKLGVPDHQPVRVFSAVEGLVTFVTAVFQGDWSKAWDGLKQVVTNNLGAIKKLVTLEVQLLFELFKKLAGGRSTGSRPGSRP